MISRFSSRIEGCSPISRNAVDAPGHPTGERTSDQTKVSGSLELCMAIDPVCGMEVDENAAPAKAEYDGELYFFCSDKCRQEFMQDPGHFIGLAA